MTQEKNKFKNREIEKKYWSIVYGKMEKKEGVIDKPLARSSSYRKQVVAGKKTKTKIRKSVTEYKVLEGWDNYSLVEVTPKTGAVVSAHVVSDEKEIFALSAKGQMIRTELATVRKTGRSAQGVHIMDLKSGDRVAGTVVI